MDVAGSGDIRCEDGNSKLLVDSNGEPHLITIDFCMGFINHTFKKDGLKWTTEAVVKNYPVLVFDAAIDANNKLHVVFSGSGNTDSGFWYANSESWKVEEIDTVYALCSLFVTKEGIPSVTFGTGQGMFYATKDNGKWDREVVTTFVPSGDITMGSSDKLVAPSKGQYFYYSKKN